MARQQAQFECKICLERKARFIVCPHCKQEKEVCAACGVNLISGDALNVKCPNPRCLHTWDGDDVSTMRLGKGVIAAFVKRYEDALVQREVNTLESANYLVRRVDEEQVLKTTLQEAKKQYKEAKSRMKETKAAHANVLNRIYMEGPSSGSIMRCRVPVEENINDCKVITECLGPIDEEAAYCLRCCTDICLLCGRARWDDEVHVCSKEDCEALRELRLKSKPCPACNIPIEKLEGCKTMFCTSCYTAFDWDSLEITRGRFHNPEHQRLVAAGVLQRQVATGEGDNFLEFPHPAEGIGYPLQAEHLYILYQLLEGILVEYKDDLRRMEGELNYHKQLYARSRHTRDEFSRLVLALHNRRTRWGAIVRELRTIKGAMQDHLQIVKEIAAVGYDGLMENIQEGATIVYNKIALNVKTIITKDETFPLRFPEFYDVIAATVQRVLPAMGVFADARDMQIAGVAGVFARLHHLLNIGNDEDD